MYIYVQLKFPNNQASHICSHKPSQLLQLREFITHIAINKQ